MTHFFKTFIRTPWLWAMMAACAGFWTGVTAQIPQNVVMTVTNTPPHEVVCNQARTSLTTGNSALECHEISAFTYDFTKTITDIVRDSSSIGTTGPVLPDDEITYTITINALTGVAPGGITITDTFDDEHFTYVSTAAPGTATVDASNSANGEIVISDLEVGDTLTITLAVNVTSVTIPTQVCNDVPDPGDGYYSGSGVQACINYTHVDYTYSKTIVAVLRDLNGDGVYDDGGGNYATAPENIGTSVPVKGGDIIIYDIDIPDTDFTPPGGATLYDVYELFFNHVSNSEGVTPTTQDVDSQLIGDEPDNNLNEGVLTFPGVEATDGPIEVRLQLNYVPGYTYEIIKDVHAVRRGTSNLPATTPLQIGDRVTYNVYVNLLSGTYNGNLAVEDVFDTTYFAFHNFPIALGSATLNTSNSASGSVVLEDLEFDSNGNFHGRIRLNVISSQSSGTVVCNDITEPIGPEYDDSTSTLQACNTYQ